MPKIRREEWERSLKEETRRRKYEPHFDVESEGQ